MQIDETTVAAGRRQLEEQAREVGYEPEQDDRDDDLRVVIQTRKAA